MAKLTRWAIFWRAFLLTFVTGSAVNADEIERAAWQKVLGDNTAASYYRYLSEYPAGEFVDQAISALSGLGAIGTQTRSVQPAAQSPGAPQVSQPTTVTGVNSVTLEVY